MEIEECRIYIYIYNWKQGSKEARKNQHKKKTYSQSLLYPYSVKTV
jgi:hypothetical protein